jgi:hypothetical protein
MTSLSKIEKSYELHKKVQSICGADKVKDILLAHYLYFLKKDDAWQAASGIETWEDYLRQPEINISRRKADKLLRIYKFFVIDNGYNYNDICKVNTSALSKIAALGISDTAKINQILDDAEHLTMRDLKESIHERTGGGEKTYTYMVMRRCHETGNLERVHDIESDQIVNVFKLE